MEFITKDIIVPKNLSMIKIDKKNEVATGYKYNVSFKKYNVPKVIIPKEHKRHDTVEKLLSHLFYSYQKKSKDQMLSLFLPEAQNAIKMLSPEKFKQQMQVVENIKKPALSYAFKYKNGIIVSWQDASFINERKIFIKKINESYKIATFKANKDDVFFWNINMFVAGFPFAYFKPILLESFLDIKNNEKKKITLKVSSEGNYVHFFKAFDKKINLTIKDNRSKDYSMLGDLNEKPQLIDVFLDGRNFEKSGTHKLYFIETNYPITSVPNDQKNNAKVLFINKKDQAAQ